ncbi:MAG: ribonuclease III [Thermoguttaceae bacterium]
MSPDDLLELCQKKIRYRFHDQELLRTALTHSSGANSPVESNERMEFLGDAILGYTICERVYRQFPDMREGDLTKIKSSVVSRATCQEIGAALELDTFLILGSGLGQSGRLPNSLLANVVESLIAAIYLDGGLISAQKFIMNNFGDAIDRLQYNADLGNFKSILQSAAQQHFGINPEYRMLESTGPAHGRCFHVSVRIGRDDYPAAWGNTKKEAEQRAAENAIAILAGTEPPYQE